jgi:hypothetical protein
VYRVQKRRLSCKKALDRPAMSVRRRTASHSYRKPGSDSRRTKLHVSATPRGIASFRTRTREQTIQVEGPAPRAVKRNESAASYCHGISGSQSPSNTEISGEGRGSRDRRGPRPLHLIVRQPVAHGRRTAGFSSVTPRSARTIVRPPPPHPKGHKGSPVRPSGVDLPMRPMPRSFSDRPMLRGCRTAAPDATLVALSGLKASCDRARSL